MTIPRTPKDRIRSMFDRLGPERVREGLKAKRFQVSDESALRRLLFRADCLAVAPRLIVGLAGVVGAVATVVSCWKA
jgi:hypothetical protein